MSWYPGCDVALTHLLSQSIDPKVGHTMNSTALINLACQVIWEGLDAETLLIRHIAGHLASSSSCLASASQMGSVLSALPLWAKWKKQTGKTLQQLIVTDRSGLIYMASVGKGAEKGVQLQADVVGIALSMLSDACEIAWRPSRGKTAWAKVPETVAVPYIIYCVHAWRLNEWLSP